MTFQNTKITKSTNFEIIVEDQKVYFSDYPDFPLFEKAIFPDAAWEQMDFDYPSLCRTISEANNELTQQYELLNQEFKDCNTRLERSTLLRDRKENDDKLYARYQQLIDPSYETPPLEQDILDLSFSDLHNFVKYVLCQPDPIDEYYDGRVNILITALRAQGYNVDPCLGEITNVPTTEFSQETHH